jgi:Transposase IS200 like
MAFDGLHIVWTTHNSWQPHDARGDWSALQKLYKQLMQNRHYYELSAPLLESIPKAAASNDAIVLTPNEQNEVKSYISELIAPKGDRIAGGSPMACCTITSTVVQLLFVPALSSHSQIIGRLKSKTASQVLWLPERKGQKHIWSSGYWFANINGAQAIAKVEQFIHKQRYN